MTIKKLKEVLTDSIESRSRISLHPPFDDIDAQIALSAIERLEQIASDTQRLLDLANSAEKWKGIALAAHGGLVSQIEQDKADAIATERESCAAAVSRLYKEENNATGYDEGWNDAIDVAEHGIRTRGPAVKPVTSSGPDWWALYEELRKATDGGSESMTHADAIEYVTSLSDDLGKANWRNVELLMALKNLVEDLELRASMKWKESERNTVDVGTGVYEQAKAVITKVEAAMKEQA